MKLFQRLLVAPAAFGLIAPLAANAADLNINDVSDYSNSIEEVDSISKFSDVHPSDWSYKALTSLAERHGCVAAVPNGSMTRYEAAALFNTCLGQVAQLNKEERLLLTEFAPELAVIKGRIDSLDSRIGGIEAGQFSTTTKMSGTTNFVIGGYGRDRTDNDTGGKTRADGATTFQYATQINLNTSFTGRDLLYTRIKAGNTKDQPFGQKEYGTYLASSATKDANSINIDKLWYQFPVGDDVTVWAGPLVENYYMLASAPSAYKPVLKQFALGGNAGAYAASTDGGFGIAWTQAVEDRSDPRFAISTNYVAKAAGSASDTAKNEGGGLFTDNQSKWLTKVEYGSPRWQVSFAVAQEMCNNLENDEKCKSWQEYYATSAGKASSTGPATAYSARAYWKPEESGFLPTFQVGYDIKNIDDEGDAGDVEQTQAWMVGLMWTDVLVDGNRAGVAFGSRAHATDIKDKTEANDDDANDNFVWEAYYDFKVSDNVTVTPAVFGGNDVYDGTDDDIFGALVQTTFKF